MKKKLRKRISAGLMISVLAVMAALLAVFAIRPHLRFVAGEYLGLNTRKITVAKISPELDKINIDALRADSRVTFDQSLMLVNSEHPLDDKDKPDLAEYKKTGVIMNACAAESFSELSAAVMEKTDCKLLVMSSVRDADEQKELYNSDSSTAAAPGASEHRTRHRCLCQKLRGRGLCQKPSRTVRQLRVVEIRIYNPLSVLRQELDGHKIRAVAHSLCRQAPRGDNIQRPPDARKIYRLV